MFVVGERCNASLFLALSVRHPGIHRLPRLGRASLIRRGSEVEICVDHVIGYVNLSVFGLFEDIPIRQSGDILMHTVDVTLDGPG